MWMLVVLAGLLVCGIWLAVQFREEGSKIVLQVEPAPEFAGYHLEQLATDRTDFVGDNSKVVRLVDQLPLPDTFYIRQSVALQTAMTPYGLTVFYEPASEMAELMSYRPDAGPESQLTVNSSRNALVLFIMIDNVDEITFAYRNSKSEQASFRRYTYRRADFVNAFDLNELRKDRAELGQLLVNWSPSAVIVRPVEVSGGHSEPAALAEATEAPQPGEPKVEHAAAESPDGRYRIESYGINKDVFAGGLYPAEGIRLTDTANKETKWSMTPGYYTQSFLWSPDSRYVAVSYMARTWSGVIIVDTNDFSEVMLPGLDELRERWDGTTTVNEQRPDPYWEAVEWLDDDRLSVSVKWTGTEDTEYSGTFIYDVSKRELMELKPNESTMH